MGKRKMVLAVSDRRNRNRGNCIIDSGASRHLINDETLLIDSATCDHEIAMADGESLLLTQVGSVRLKVIARGVESTVMLTDVYLAPRLAKIIISYGTLERRGFALVYENGKRALARHSGGSISFDAVMGSNILYVDVTATQERHGADNAIMAKVEVDAITDVISDVQDGTLLHLHQRLGHLALDTIERMV